MDYNLLAAVCSRHNLVIKLYLHYIKVGGKMNHQHCK